MNFASVDIKHGDRSKYTLEYNNIEIKKNAYLILNRI